MIKNMPINFFLQKYLIKEGIQIEAVYSLHTFSQLHTLILI